MDLKVVDEPSLRYKKRVFRDRMHAGQLLAAKLAQHQGEACIVLAIPSGGVPVGRVVADRLGSAFDVIVVRKIQIPWEPEAGFGAVTWDGDVLLNEPLVKRLHLTQKDIDYCISVTKEEIERRVEKLRGNKPFPDLMGKNVILIDDGLASGFTMLAAVKSVVKLGSKWVVVAIPTASKAALNLVTPYANKVICLNIRDEIFYAVADAYREWHDLQDEEVLTHLKKP